MSGGLFVLATLNPTLGQRQKAAALALLMICGCMLTLPLAGLRVPRFDSLVLIVDTVLATLALLAAALLYVQFAITRIPALWMLACGFLLLALTTVPQLLRESTGASIDLRLQFFSDLALPLAAVAYSLLRHERPQRLPARGAAVYVSGGIAATAGLAALATWITIAGYDPGEAAVGATMTWRVLTTAALVVLFGLAIAPLWRRRSSVLDLWLLVTLTAWLLDVLMRGVALDESSFTWHFARLYGLLGTACMVLALLSENAIQFSRLVRLLSLRGGLDRHAQARSRNVTEAELDALANELNQPLCAITANADAVGRLLEREPADLREVRAALADIIMDAGRASETLRSVRRQGADVIDVSQLVDECLEQLRTELSSRRIACQVETGEQLPGVRGARHELLQLLVNLVTHSLEAMSRVQHRQHCLRVSTRRHDQGVAIFVEDSGEGVPSRSESRLVLCHDIVNAHGGRFTVMAGAEGGATFKVVLPGS